jgi:ElaB/YqjD/DUF883 family membrane-anchored ribosome-binding protein
MSLLQNTSKNSIKPINLDPSCEISDDLKSIKDGSVDLARHLKEDVVHIAESVAAEGQHRYDDAKSFAGKYMKAIENEVTEKPMQSVALAIGAGALLGLLLRRM